MVKNILNPDEILNRVALAVQLKARAAIDLITKEPKTAEQLFLFEDFKQYNDKIKKIKNEKGLTPQQEAAAQLLALGFALTEIYVLTHPGTSKENKASLWVRASKFCAGKVRLRAEEIRKQADTNALMPLTEAYTKLTDIARNAVKDEVRRQALVDILKLHGEYKERQEVNSNIKVEVLGYADAAAAPKENGSKDAGSGATAQRQTLKQVQGDGAGVQTDGNNKTANRRRFPITTSEMTKSGRQVKRYSPMTDLIDNGYDRNGGNI